MRSVHVAFDTQMCVYMCLIDLLIDHHTQHGLTAIIKTSNLSFEKSNHSFVIFVFVLSQVVVAECNNAYKSTLFRLVERVNVIGSVTDHHRSSLPRATSVRQ